MRILGQGMEMNRINLSRRAAGFFLAAILMVGMTCGVSRAVGPSDVDQVLAK
jgi:hypothetical protein